MHDQQMNGCSKTLFEMKGKMHHYPLESLMQYFIDLPFIAGSSEEAVCEVLRMSE